MKKLTIKKSEFKSYFFIKVDHIEQYLCIDLKLRSFAELKGAGEKHKFKSFAEAELCLRDYRLHPAETLRWKCEFCGFQRKDYDEVIEHEKVCVDNPENKDTWGHPYNLKDIGEINMKKVVKGNADVSIVGSNELNEKNIYIFVRKDGVPFKIARVSGKFVGVNLTTTVNMQSEGFTTLQEYVDYLLKYGEIYEFTHIKDFYKWVGTQL